MQLTLVAGALHHGVHQAEEAGHQVVADAGNHLLQVLAHQGQALRHHGPEKQWLHGAKADGRQFSSPSKRESAAW